MYQTKVIFVFLGGSKEESQSNDRIDEDTSDGNITFKSYTSKSHSFSEHTKSCKIYCNWTCVKIL